uniref:GOLD domain-containing protein n=1 Tax=Romanomermis culicivorax TaxID=13658 RepID=A0A915IMC0_ROMCU
MKVIEGGNLDISFQLIDPQGKPLASDHQRMDSLVRINVTNILGDYKLCFNNTFSQQSKLIFFQIVLEDQTGNSDDLQYEQLAAGNLVNQMQESIEEIRVLCAKIKINLNNAEGHQSTLRALEARDRMLMESSYERVNFWSFTALIIMLIVGVAQVFTIRTLFIDDSKFGKFLRGGKR